MKIEIAIVLAMLLPACVVGDGSSDPEENADTEGDAVVNEQGVTASPPHLYFSQSAKQASGKSSSSPLMVSHGGKVLVTNKTKAIFWGSRWSNASFAGDKITGLDSFFSGWGGSRYAATTTEYIGTNGKVTAASTYLGHVLDKTAAPSGELTTKTAVAEACKITGNNPDPNALYLIYTATAAGQVDYCAWHSNGTCSNGAPLQVAYMPNIDGVNGCVVSGNTYGHSVPLASLANHTAHELAETITDPSGGGWYDADGEENGDKCAWAFGGPVKLSNGSTWKLQMEWSNKAFKAGTGLPNNDGQKGCLAGQ